MAHCDETTRIWDTGLTDPDSLTDGEQRRFVWFVAQLFFVVEGLFRQHRRGFLSEESWRPFMTLVTGLLQNQIARNWWSSGVSPFSMESRAYVDEEISGETVEPWKYTRLSELRNAAADPYASV